MLENTFTLREPLQEQEQSSPEVAKLLNKSQESLFVLDAILNSRLSAAQVNILLTSTRINVVGGVRYYISDTGNDVNFPPPLQRTLGIEMVRTEFDDEPTVESVDRFRQKNAEVFDVLRKILSEKMSLLDEKRQIETSLSLIEDRLEGKLSPPVQDVLFRSTFVRKTNTGEDYYANSDGNDVFISTQVRSKYGIQMVRLDYDDEPTEDSVNVLRENQKEILELIDSVLDEQASGKSQTDVEASIFFLKALLGNELLTPRVKDVLFQSNFIKRNQRGNEYFASSDGNDITIPATIKRTFGIEMAGTDYEDEPSVESVNALRENQSDLLEIGNRVADFETKLSPQYKASFDLVKNEFAQLTEAPKTMDSFLLIIRRESIALYEEAVAIFTEVASLIRILNLEQVFFSFERTESDPFDSQINAVNSFNARNSEETAVVRELIVIAYQSRRRRKIISFAQEIKNGGTGLVTVTQLEKSESPNDVKLGNFLRVIMYKRLINDLKITISNEFSNGIAFSPEAVLLALDSFPIQPSVNGYDFFGEVQKIREDAVELSNQLMVYKLLAEANEIRSQFRSGNPQAVLDRIRSGFVPNPNLKESRVVASQIQTLLESEFTTFIAAEDADFFDTSIAGDLRQQLQDQLAIRYLEPSLDRNKAALRFLGGNFSEVFQPLFQTLRASPTSATQINRYLMREIDPITGRVTGSDPKLLYTQRLNELRAQRELSPTEEEYIRSVELMTVMNPHLVAILSQEFAVTDTYLRHHFESLSKKTEESLNDNDYVPLLQIGLGPNGVNAAGELARQNPGLLANTLFVDQGEQPGGPFAIPGGAAWELNSANRRKEGIRLPDLPPVPEKETVRGFGSPLRIYPGERNEGSAVRTGSINTTVDFLPTTDNLSLNQYPTNEELAALVQAQAALLVKKALLKTVVTSIRENTDSNQRGMYLADLAITQADGTVLTKTVRTDGVFISSGLGESTLGFDTKGKRAEKIVNKTTRKGKKLLSSTLDYFNEIANRKGEKERDIGETIVIIGSGNSADVLIEYLAGIFAQGDNNAIRNIEKIYIISNTDLSKRPRYARITDVKGRNGNKALVEQIRTRVDDVDEAEDDPEKLSVFDGSGQAIKDKIGNVIKADRVVSTAGFKPNLDKVLAPLLEQGDTMDIRKANTPTSAREPLTLPGKAVPVADTLKNHPNIMFLGTAAAANFDSSSPFSKLKLAQLPTKAREALLRNGVENAVALGFRGPDVQAGVNIWLNERDVQLDAAEAPEKPPINAEGPIQSVEEQITVDQENLMLRNDMMYREEIILSSLLIYNLTTDVGTFTDASGDSLTKNLEIALRIQPDGKTFSAQLTDTSDGLSQDFALIVKKCLADQDFQRFAVSLLNSRRGRDPKIDIKIEFKRGKIRIKNSYVQGG